MAQSYVDPNSGAELIIPGAYPSITVEPSQGGLAANGILMLVGEADQGPDFTLESSLNANSFGPDSDGDVVNKYKSGNLVDAYKVAISAANDPAIPGAPARVILVKTNPSTKAHANLPKIGGGVYAVLADSSYGKLGSLIYTSITAKTKEVVPTTGNFLFAPPVAPVDFAIRVSGGASLALSFGAAELPQAIVAAIDGLSDVACSGGVDRTVLTSVAGNLALAVVGGSQVTVTYDGTWSVNPIVGDLLYIGATSAIAGGSGQNCGSYVISNVTSSVITATKFANATGTPGLVTAPVAATAAVGSTNDVRAYSPVVITVEGSSSSSSNAGDAIDGIGKSIEVIDPQTNISGEKLVHLLYQAVAPVAAVDWLSIEGVPEILVSASEYAVNANISRQLDNIAETVVAGGQIALLLGYVGDTATVTITPTALTTTRTGGLGGDLSINLKDFPTLADLAAYINAQAGYICRVNTAILKSFSALGLDEVVSAGICTTNGAFACRIKNDATRFYQAVNGVPIVQLNVPKAPAAVGLPDVTASTIYLAGGTKGGTTQAVFAAAIDRLKATTGNFVIPLFSRDALEDILDGLTESSSTYAIDDINAYVSTHVNQMSTIKRRRNRQAFCSKRDLFETVKTAAANLAAYRTALTFQDVKRSVITITQYQPWMAAVLAAGMQAAGFYKTILAKGVNCSGILQAAADFDDQNDDNMEEALKAGLLPLKVPQNGVGFTWASDQTTYGKDNNFVYNSIQAVYVADVVALSCAQSMERMFVGQSIADISATIALSALKSLMDNYRRLKLITASDDAPSGYRNAKIKISGPALIVSLEIKLATSIYFVPISFLVTQVQQSAG